MSDASRTLILVKPDAFERGLTGEVLARFERKGLRIVALRLLTADEDIANRHYAEHTEKPFFGELVEFITGGPLVAAVLEGVEAVAAARQLIGATNPVEAATGSIRGDFALEVTFNLVHGSDSDESAAREIEIWFPDARRAADPRLGIAPPAGDAERAGGGVRGGRARTWMSCGTGMAPEELVVENARRKAEAGLELAGRGRRTWRSGWIPRCSWRDGRWGRRRRGEARERLVALSGRTHEVLSAGVALADFGPGIEARSGPGWRGRSSPSLTSTTRRSRGLSGERRMARSGRRLRDPGPRIDR